MSEKSEQTEVLRNSWFHNGELIPAGTPISELKEQPTWDMIVTVDAEMNIISEPKAPKKNKQEAKA